MGRVKKVFYLAIVLIVAYQVQSVGQVIIAENYKASEIFVGIGSTHYFGDVGGPSGTHTGFSALVDNFGLDLEQTKYGGIIGYRYIRNDNIAFSAQLAPLLIAGSDVNSRLESRGYSFFTYVVEASARVEWFISNRVNGLAPYVFAGLGGIAYNVKDRANQVWSGTSFGNNFHLGMGIRLPSRSKFTHALEIGFRYCSQDDIDLMKGPQAVGDTYYVLAYVVNFDFDRTFRYNYNGRIKK